MFSDMAEVHQALEMKSVSLHTKILARVPQADEKGNISMQRFETTAGRMLIGECLPKNFKVPFDIVNRLLTKKDIADVIDEVYRHTGQKDTVLFADAIMSLGFRHAFKAGISFGKDDMIIPESKEGMVEGNQEPRRRLRAAVSGRPDHAAGESTTRSSTPGASAATGWPMP